MIKFLMVKAPKRVPFVLGFYDDTLNRNVNDANLLRKDNQERNRCVLFFYCPNCSKSGCNLFRRTYSMMAPTRNATASAMTSDQTTP